jgi:Peptidase family C54
MCMWVRESIYVGANVCVCVSVHSCSRTHAFVLYSTFWISPLSRIPFILPLAQLVSLFADTPTAPFSVHRIAAAARKPTGEWLGPSTVAYTLRNLMEEHRPLTLPLCVSVARDLLVCVDEIHAEVKRAASDTVECAWVPLLLVVPVRLGLGHLIDQCYHTGLLSMFQEPQFVGIIGGRPRASLYFVAAQGRWNSLLRCGAHL